MSIGKLAALSALKAARSLSSRDRQAYIFANESVGSIGDQAMSDVARRHLSDKGYRINAIYMPGWTPYVTRGDYKDIVLTRLDKRSVDALDIYAKADLLMAVGADVMDGVYGPDLPLKWLKDLAFAQSLGIANAAVNFSFSETPDKAVCEAMRRAQGTSFEARDPVSRQRFEATTGQKADISADLAFLLQPEITGQRAAEARTWVVGQKAKGHTVLGVNASGHTLEKMDGDGAAAYAAICRSWLERDAARSIMLVPHDHRPAPVGDVEALETVAERLADFGDRVFMLRPDFAAWEVKALCEHFDLLITGRMHFAIAGFGTGAPALNVVYQGKFEGLMQHLDLESADLLADPAAILKVTPVAEQLERLTANADGIKRHLKAKLPEIHALSRRNFAWLEAK